MCVHHDLKESVDTDPLVELKLDGKKDVVLLLDMVDMDVLRDVDVDDLLDGDVKHGDAGGVFMNMYDPGRTRVMKSKTR